MSTNTRTLQRRAAQMLLDCITHSTICQRLSIRESTLRRWRRSPSFIAILDRLKQERTHEMELTLLKITDSAIENLSYHWFNNSTKHAINGISMLDVLSDINKNNRLTYNSLQNQQESAGKRHASARKPAPSAQSSPNQPG